MMANEPSTHEGASTCLRAKHEIFLSHSGVQKGFTEQLCKDLKSVGYCPFFDKEAESLPKGEKFPPLIFQAARECHVAILVISEEFFSCSKWPMIELSEFVQAQASVNSDLKILPLFFGLDINQVKDEGNMKRWQGIWQGWANEDERINVEKWMKALSEVLKKTNGMEYNARVGEVSYREDVVAAVCRLVNVNFNVSDVQASPRLCEAISKRLDEDVESSSTPGCRVVGLFAMGGSGKTTISKAMCSHKFGEFVGKVCHVEFGDTNTYTKLRQKVLKELTGFDPNRLPDDLDKLKTSLKNGMKRQMVFLVLDNVWETDIEEVKMYLRVGFKEGSKVLVTSRSLCVLKSLNLKDSECMEMPELEEEDAIKLFLSHAVSDREQFSQEEGSSIRRCVEACKFAKRGVDGLENASSTHQYLPLALKVWGIQLGQISEDPLQWLGSLKRLRNHKFNHFCVLDHPLFSLLRQGYDALKPMNQHVFLDLALFFPRSISGNGVGYKDKYNVVEWLKIFCGCKEDDIICILLALRRQGLLEEFGGEDGLEFRIHDLYLEFAREEVKAGRFDERRILHLEGTDIPSELRKRQRSESLPTVERLGLYKSTVTSLTKSKLHDCPNVEMLQLYECRDLVEVDVQGLENLKSLDILWCHCLGMKFVGVEKLEDLVWFRWEGIVEPAPILRDFSTLTALQVLHLGFGCGTYLDTPVLSGCINLRELTIENWKSKKLPDLSNLSKLQKILFHECHLLRTVRGLNFLTSLKILSLKSCIRLQELPGLSDLGALEILILFMCCSLSKLDGLEKLQHLQDLNVKRCSNLSSLDGLEYLTSLRRLDATGCDRLKISDCSHLQKYEKIALSGTAVCVLPVDFGRLANSCILELRECRGLIEPLLSWWMFQLSRIYETTDGWISPGFQFPEQSRSQLVQAINDVAAHHLSDASIFITGGYFISLPSFFTCPSTENPEVWGVRMVIESLCYSENSGILSLFVAKYAAIGKYWELLTDESMTHVTFSDDGPYHSQTTQVLLMSYRVVHFLAQKLHEIVCNHQIHQLGRIQFILMHMTKNQIVATALGHNNICHFIRVCLDLRPVRESRRRPNIPPTLAMLDGYRRSSPMRIDGRSPEIYDIPVCGDPIRHYYFDEALERCKLGEQHYLRSRACGQSAVGPFYPPC